MSRALQPFNQINQQQMGCNLICTKRDYAQLSHCPCPSFSMSLFVFPVPLSQYCSCHSFASCCPFQTPHISSLFSFHVISSHAFTHFFFKGDQFMSPIAPIREVSKQCYISSHSCCVMFCWAIWTLFIIRPVSHFCTLNASGWGFLHQNCSRMDTGQMQE